MKRGQKLFLVLIDRYFCNAVICGFFRIKNLAFGHWIHGSVLTAFTYSILAGVMIGRIVGMRLKIKNILSEQSISV